MQRDFTYIDDIVEGIVRVADHVPVASELAEQDRHPGISHAPYRVYNIGNNQPVELGRFIEVLEEKLGVKAEKRYLPMQAGDVLATYADVDELTRDVGFRPSTPIEEGVEKFVEWYRAYHKMSVF
jgi:UDP-glucuronate 4-epimerase